MRRIQGLIGFFVLFSLPLKLGAAYPDFLFGAGTHLALGRNDGAFVQSLIEGGVINSFRDDLNWSMAERVKGRYDFRGSLRRLDELVLSSPKNAFPLLILAYGNENYGGGFPLTDEARAGFVEYTRAAALRYGNHVFAFEIWNEWNIGAGNRKSAGRQGDPAKYVELVAASARAIREHAPAAKILCGSVTDLDVKWIEAVLEKGMLSHCDGLSVHPYVYSNGRRSYPVNVFQWLDRVAAMVAGAPGGAGKKIYITELGWPTHAGKGGSPEDRAASFLIQSLALARTRDYVAGLWWYELTDGKDNNPGDRESNFGIYRNNYDQKAAARALEKTAKLLRAARFEGEGKVGESGQWVRFSDAQSGDPFIVMWGRSGEREGYCLQSTNDNEVLDVRGGDKFADRSSMISSSDSPLVLRFRGKSSSSPSVPVTLARNGRCN